MTEQTRVNEKKAVENPIFDWIAKLWRTTKTPEELSIYERPNSQAIVVKLLEEKIAQINDIPMEHAQQVVQILLQRTKHPDLLVANELFLQWLQNGITYTIDGEHRDIAIIDFDNIRNNSLIVTQQYRVKGLDYVIPDIVLLVNGIPLVCIEAKQFAMRSTNWMDGVKQLAKYSFKCPDLYISNLFGVAPNGRVMKYGIPWASSQYYGDWKNNDIIMDCGDNPLIESGLCKVVYDENGWASMEIDALEKMKMGILWLLQPARVLDILQFFVVFEKTEDWTIKKIARYQQMRAANKIVERVTKNTGNAGIIWHTQGSWKSLTMVYTAYKLKQQKELWQPTIYLIVDRKDLRKQIWGTFDDCEFPNTSKPANAQILQSKILHKPSEVIITTIHKFRDLGEIKDDRDNVIVLIDEAHRTQYGDYRSELKKVLPNAKHFAFTGTPIPKTHKEFAKQEELYLDKYSVVDAIEDWATVPIRYTFWPQEWHLDKENMEQGRKEITEELNEEEKKIVQKKVQPWKTFLKHPDRVKALAEDIAKDFKAFVDPNNYKAQVVACDKETCVAYYNELCKYFQPEEMAVVFSEGSKDTEEQYKLFSPHYKNEVQMKKTIRNFKKRITDEEIKNGNNLKILIVCNMLLTGFDAPIEQTMYLDSPIRDHNLLQAIARTNRPYVDKKTELIKQYGRIVDYVGVFKNLQDALQYDPKDIGEFESIDEFVKQFPHALAKGLSYFHDINLENTYDCQIAIIRRLHEIDLTEFEKDFGKVVQLYEAISPHPDLVDYRQKYRWLLDIYQMYLEEFKRKDFDAELYVKKTRDLLHKSAKMLDFTHLPTVNIDGDYIKNLEGSYKNPSDMAEKIIRDIETIIRENEARSPIYETFFDKIQELIKQKKDNIKSIEELVKDLKWLYEEVNDLSSLPEKLWLKDIGRVNVFMEIKNSLKLDDSYNDQIKKYTEALVSKLENEFYIWRYESEKMKKDVLLETKVIWYNEEFEKLWIGENEELANKVLWVLIKSYRM